jgi:hypothetical protein
MAGHVSTVIALQRGEGQKALASLGAAHISIFTLHYDEEIFGLLILILCCFMSV